MNFSLEKNVKHSLFSLSGSAAKISAAVASPKHLKILINSIEATIS